MNKAFEQWESNNIPKTSGKPVSSVLITRKRYVKETTEYDIYELSTPTIGGSTHVAVNRFGDPIVLLSQDKEGCWLVEQNVSGGEIDSFYGES